MFGEGVGEAVAEVEGGGVVALAELSPSAAGGGDLFRRYGDDLDGLSPEMHRIPRRLPGPVGFPKRRRIQER